MLDSNMGMRLAGDGLIAVTLLLTADVAWVMRGRIGAVVLKDTYRSIFRYELLLCGILLLFSLDVRFGLLTALPSRGTKAAGWAIRIAAAAMTAAILFLCGRVVLGGLVNTVGPAEDAVVLGMALEDGRPTGDLLSRTDVAAAYLNEHPNATLILTGGNPDAAGNTEAAVMRGLLLERGAGDGRMRLEDRAATTEENFDNTIRMLPPDAPIVLITSDYHMDRAVRMARRAGFSRVLRLPAPSDPLRYGANMMWEVVLAIHDLVR